jgi:transcriptional regulator with XRE-family HTH domain
VSKERNQQSFPAHIGPRIQRLRAENGLTQAQLAEGAGLSIASVSRLESGKGADVDTICRIAAALGVVPGRLLDPEGSVISHQEVALLAGVRRLSVKTREAVLHFVEAMAENDSV